MTSLTIQGEKFEVPDAGLAKYDHFLTPEAPEGLRNTVRQTLLENLRNNFAGKVKEGLNGGDELDPVKREELQGAFEQYAHSYEFGLRSIGSIRRTDPFEKQMYKLAKAVLSTRYKAVHKEAPPKDWLEEMVPQLIEKDYEGYAARVREMRKISETLSRAVGEMAI